MRGSKSSSGETQEQDDKFEHVSHHKQEENWLSCPSARFLYPRVSGLEFLRTKAEQAWFSCYCH